MLSKSTVYGIRAALYVSLHGEQQNYVPIRQIAEDLNISFHFLTKILQTLTHQHLMISYRGPKGGVSLAKPANEITLMEMIYATEGNQFFDDCILAFPSCNESSPCPFHLHWAATREKIKSVFENTSLAALGEQNEVSCHIKTKHT